ncbi:MAG: DEAD/DEAH box helicase [Candidatus Coprovivens sp.]
MSDKYIQYDIDYISGVMSLREPQRKSLEILDDIMKNSDIRKDSKEQVLEYINSKYPICTDFERNFISLTFALATGVGKTRLMGTFITYLYTNHNIKNFLVVAPNTTIYEKLKMDLGGVGSSKYVFNGLGCFNTPPRIITDDNYAYYRNDIFNSDVNIFIYNISKFDKDNTKMKAFNETLGMSFYDLLAEMKDLVIIMDESHHYRADKGMTAINELKPVIGLELTATPIVNSGSKQIPFKNVVFDYPLGKAISDGYTRVPYAVTRTDINFHDFGEEAIDKLMLNDGIICHKLIKEKLRNYAFINNKRPVKPFMMVVCKDINHAMTVEKYIKSDSFENGFYANKTIIINSKMSGAESEMNTKALLSVEDYNNPIEIVIHVNMLKEGWDVNNLYTIVPLRTATSKILREQMVGRGLRLPYGERTGEKEIDSVMLTAHDKFADILEEASRGDSIFNKQNIIDLNELENNKVVVTQLNLEFSNNDELSNIIQSPDQNVKNKFSNDLFSIMVKEVEKHIYSNPSDDTITNEKKEEIKNNIENEIKNNLDYGVIYEANKEPLEQWIKDNIVSTHEKVVEKYIMIPRIKTEKEDGEYYFEDFDLDLTNFNKKPIENDLLIRNLINSSDEEVIKAGYINFEATNPGKLIVEQLRKRPEINYEENSQLINKLVMQVIKHYEEEFDNESMKNIVMMYKQETAKEIYTQMMKHFVRNEGILKEEVFYDRKYNLKTEYTYNIIKNIFELYTSDRDGKITSILFDGIENGVFSEAKFDSEPELLLARQLEREKDYVETWLRPNINEFSITYNYGKKYEPDFVVETEKYIYLVEVKADNQMDNDDVIAKMREAIKYCKTVSEYNGILNIKKWKYVLIPATKITQNSTFKNLVDQYTMEE